MNKLILPAILLCVMTAKLHAQEWVLSKSNRQLLASHTDTVHYKFPLIKALDSTMLDTATVIQRTKYLDAFNEPALFFDSSTDQTVRLTCLRSKNHPVMIRMVLHGNHVTLYWKECDGAGSTKPGKLMVDKQKILTTRAWHDFRKLALKINTCKVDVSNEAPDNRTSEWLLEGKLGYMYVLTKQNSPVPGSDFYKSCDYLIGLTDLVIPAEEKY